MFINFEYHGVTYPFDVDTEVVITQLIATVLGLPSEVSIDTGRVDLVLGDYVIEAKTVGKALSSINWKHAIGQALVYGETLKKKPAVLFIGSRNKDIESYCEKFGVACWWMDELLACSIHPEPLPCRTLAKQKQKKASIDDDWF